MNRPGFRVASRPAIVGVVMCLWGCASQTPSEPLGPPPPQTTPAPRAILVGRFRIEFRSLEKDRTADPPIPGRVLVTIIRNDRLNGVVTWSAYHREGDLLGRPSGSVSTRHQAVDFKGRPIGESDFDTGLTLLEVTPNQVVGIKTIEGLRTFVADSIIVGRADGSWEWLHLGPGEDIDVNQGPPQLAYSDRDVVRILWEADEGWKSRNPVLRYKARDSYRLLLRECPEKELVKRERARISQRADAEIED